MTPPTNIQTRIKNYVESKNEDYYWDGKDGRQCSLLLNRIRFLYFKRKGTQPTDDETYNVFVLIWTEKPDWIETVPVLNSKFNETIAAIKKRLKSRIGEPLPEVGW